MEQNDREIGSIVGLAVGDAVGTTLEFQETSDFGPIDDMGGGGQVYTGRSETVRVPPRTARFRL
jgi:ADP-ribosylglycohydrolase